MPPTICKRVYDYYGKEVTANSLVRGNIDNFRKGMIFTLRNNEYTFWAEVECVKQIGKRYWFRSVIYGWMYIVNYNNDTVIIQE